MKKLLCLTLNVLMSTLLISCGGSNGKLDEFKPSLDVETNCKIRVVGDYSNFEALENEFDKFNKYYPNVILEYDKLDDYQNTLATTLSAEHDRPNIFFSYTWMIGNEKYNSVVDHMEELSDAKLKLNIDCIRPSLINRDEQGKVFMAPIFSRTYGTLVNNDLFKKENLKIPTKWSELLSVCKSFLEKEYKSPMMGYSKDSSSCLMNAVAYPTFLADIANNPSAIALANKPDPAAGEYARNALEKVKKLVDDGCVNIEECNAIGDNYDKVILRFFEGDVPMMICAGDVVSGTKKREEKSPAFKESPFTYSYIPLPVTEQGGYFVDSPSIEFSVNKECENLDMTNEFMRFLLRDSELNDMAAIKRLTTTAKTMTFDKIYAEFGKVPKERTYSPEVLGVKDALTIQIRIAAYKVGKGELTVDEAIAQYGTF